MSLSVLAVATLSGPAQAADASSAPVPARATVSAGAPADNTLCIYSTDATDKSTPGYALEVGKQAHKIWWSKEFKEKYGHLRLGERMGKLIYELNVAQHVFGHSWMVYFNKDGKFERQLANGEQAHYDTLSFQVPDPNGINGDGSAVDGLSINYTGYDVNEPGKPLTEWDRPSRKQEGGKTKLPRSGRCVTLNEKQQANFKKEIDRRIELKESYTLMPDKEFLFSGGKRGKNAANCTTFALQVWDKVMEDTPSERLIPTKGEPAAELNKQGAEEQGIFFQPHYSSWIPAIAGKWIFEKNGNQNHNAAVPRFADDHVEPSFRK